MRGATILEIFLTLAIVIFLAVVLVGKYAQDRDCRERGGVLLKRTWGKDVCARIDSIEVQP